ncbi:hypothetical protein SADUNF_Sadunf02G0018800 [Salix dunnii]|uniref:Uncharacterized protein n=1 Tax=Salix dunnii TaxID=1413687 RepID=A0A835N5M3_9ROSI|nr:hypothetical protein SADUNF_Sadunf02G0018800 [Salix dunnii]
MKATIGMSLLIYAWYMVRILLNVSFLVFPILTFEYQKVQGNDAVASRSATSTTISIRHRLQKLAEVNKVKKEEPQDDDFDEPIKGKGKGSSGSGSGPVAKGKKEEANSDDVDDDHKPIFKKTPASKTDKLQKLAEVNKVKKEEPQDDDFDEPIKGKGKGSSGSGSGPVAKGKKEEANSDDVDDDHKPIFKKTPASKTDKLQKLAEVNKVKKEEPQDDDFDEPIKGKGKGSSGSGSGPVAKGKKEEANSDDVDDDHKPIFKKTPASKTDKVIWLYRSSVWKQIFNFSGTEMVKRSEQNVKKRERKVYDFSRHKRDPPEERDPLRIFYETLFEQIPDSEMAQFWRDILSVFFGDVTPSLGSGPLVILSHQNFGPANWERRLLLAKKDLLITYDAFLDPLCTLNEGTMILQALNLSYEKIVDCLWCLRCNHIMNCVESVAFANTNTNISLMMLIESGLLPMEVAKKVYDKKQKRNKFISPVKAGSVTKKTQSATVTKKAPLSAAPNCQCCICGDHLLTLNIPWFDKAWIAIPESQEKAPYHGHFNQMKLLLFLGILCLLLCESLSLSAKERSPPLIFFFSLEGEKNQRELNWEKESRETMAFRHGYCTLYDEFRDDEVEVAEILSSFPRLIAMSKYSSWLPYTWSGKRRRSAEANLGPRPAVQSPPASVSPSPSPILSVSVGPAFTTTTTPIAASEPEKPITVKVEPATSPATPLSFFPSEFDERPKRLKRKVSTEKRREDLLKIKSQFTRSNEFLRGEIQKVTGYHEHLKAINSCWKARKQELTMGVIKREDQLNLLRMNLGQATVKCPDHIGDDQSRLSLRMPGIPVYQQQPFLTDKNANNQEMGCNHPDAYGQRVFLLPSTTTSTSDANGPHSIPDLNLAIGQPSWMNTEVKQLVGDKSTVVNRAIVDNKAITVRSTVNKAMAAEARRRRILICKKKISCVSRKL